MFTAVRSLATCKKVEIKGCVDKTSPLSTPDTKIIFDMGKKRKAGRSGAGVPKVTSNEDETVTTARYDQDETFVDSQDEFFAGKDQIMVEEGPLRKRRKQIEEEGMNTPNVFGLPLTKPKITT